MAINKVVVGTEVKLDLTTDTVTPETLLEGATAHGADGEQITGTCTYDADTQDATAAVAEVLAGKTYYGQGVKKTGTMPNRGGVTGSISTKAGSYSIPQGYHDGSGSVSIDVTEQAKLIPGNIKAGVEILGVTGSMTGEEDIQTQAKSVTPGFTAQVIVPDAGYDYLSQVTVAAIPVTETDNAAGGKTLTIG